MNSVKIMLQYVAMTISSILVHGTMLRNCRLTGETLKTFLHQAKGSFYRNPGGGPMGETYTYEHWTTGLWYLPEINEHLQGLEYSNNLAKFAKTHPAEMKLRSSFHHDETKSGALVVTPQSLGDTHKICHITTQAHPKVSINGDLPLPRCTPFWFSLTWRRPGWTWRRTRLCRSLPWRTPPSPRSSPFSFFPTWRWPKEQVMLTGSQFRMETWFGMEESFPQLIWNQDWRWSITALSS